MKKQDIKILTLTDYKRKERTLALVFIVPSVLFMLYMVFYPILNSAYLSFFKWNGISPNKKFVGFDNYKYVFNDQKFWTSMKNNFIWMVMHLVFAAFYGLIIAFLISRVKKGRLFFRTVLFLPNVVALSVSAIMWRMMYNSQYGVIMSILNAIGVNTQGFSFLSNYKTAIYFVALASSWQGYGYYMMLFLAGMQSIDVSLYEAASLDGANTLQQFRYVTIPSLQSVFTFVISIAIINGLRGFSTAWVMTSGGPGTSTYLVAIYGYVKAFVEQNMGPAMVSGLLVGVIIIAITLVFNSIRDKKALN